MRWQRSGAVAVLALLGVGPGAGGGVVLAAADRVAVLPFRGPEAGAVEKAVAAAIPRRYQVVPAAEVDRAVRGSPTSKADYAAIARRLKADALVEGRVSEGRSARQSHLQLRLFVREAAGGAGPGSSKSWKANGKRQLVSAVKKSAGVWMGAQLARAGDPAPVASRRRLRPPVQEPWAPPPEPVAEAEADEQAEAVSSQASGPAAGTSQRALLSASIGPRLFARSFVFTDNLAGLPGYNLSGAPGLAAELELFPGARLRGFVRDVGVAGRWESSLGAKTEGRNGGPAYSTSISYYRAGPRYRMLWSGFALTAGADLGQHRFHLGFDEAIAPNVAYNFLRPSLDARIELRWELALALSAAYVHVLSAGGLGDPSRFPRMTSLGAEARAALSYPLRPDLELELGADLRHYAHDMHARPGDAYLVGGAVDEHFGVSLLATYRLR